MLDISLSVSPFKDAAGKIIGASAIARDVTERRRARERQNLLVKEFKHRIKNTLATVQSIATQTFRSSPDECAVFVARLHALAAAHDLLTNDDQHQAALVDLVGRALIPFQDERSQRFHIDGPDGIFLKHRSSLLIMALHELATNAAKYGALSNATGQVRVAWDIPDGGPPKRLRLCWKESGGPPVTPPEQKGFGSFLIERALQKNQLGQARSDFEPGGLVCSIEIFL